MDFKLKITDIYKKKINLLKKHNQFYFNDDNPKITDERTVLITKKISIGIYSIEPKVILTFFFFLN